MFFTWFFSNHFANCFSLIKLLRWEFPYINSSFSIVRKVFWGMCRSKLFDKSLEKESYWLKEKKNDSWQIKHNIFQKTNVPLT